VDRVRVLVPLGTDKNDGNVGHGEVHFARRNYLERIYSEGLLPLLISPFTAQEDAQDLLSECAGLFLMGGDDIDAAHYGEKNHERNTLVIPERDTLELALVATALEQRIPILGICRGAQVMAVASGGSLQQHIPDLSGVQMHGASEGFTTYDKWVSSLQHDVHIDGGSHAARIFKQSVGLSVNTNSAHHQAVKEPGEIFRIVGRSEDGIAEIIEHVVPEYFAFGIQSHPEVDADAPLHPFFTAFAEACTAFAGTYRASTKR